MASNDPTKRETKASSPNSADSETGLTDTAAGAYPPRDEGAPPSPDGALSAHVIDEMASAVCAPQAAEPPPPNDREAADFPRNDLGNARRLIHRHGHDLLFVDAAGWFDWDGRRWQPPPAKRTPEAQKRAHQTVEAIVNEARALQSELDEDLASGRLNANDKSHAEVIEDRKERISAHRKFAIASGNSGRIAAMLTEAEPYLRRAAADLDADAYLFNVSNGTLVLGPVAKDGTVTIGIRPHHRLDLITHMSPVAYDPDATAPRFLKFLEQILPNPEIRLFLQILLGYCVTGDVSEQVMALLHGTGANGKSTVLKIVAAVFGDYAITLPIQTFLADERRSGGDATPDLARLPGTRLAMASEPERGSRLSEAVVKTITGGERVVARRLFEGQFEFDPSFKLILSANEKPRITGQDEGIWRRVILVPFDIFITRSERNRKLFNTLLAELPGILNWLLDGYRLWRERGLVIPEVLVAATDQYRAESDPVGEFLRVCTNEAEHAQLRAKDLYDVYALWCRHNAINPISSNAFGRRLSDRGVHKETVQVVYYALALTEEGSRLFEELRRRSSKEGGEGTASGSNSGKLEE